MGKPRISPVHSLGLRGRPAGGVGERMARPVRRFVEAEILSDGGAPRGTAMDLPPPGCSQLRRAVLCLFPVPELVVRRLRFERLDGDGDGDGFEGDDDDGRWRLFRAEFSRLPVRLGTLSDPRLLRRSGGGAPWYVFFVNGGLDDLQDLCVIFFNLGAVL